MKQILAFVVLFLSCMAAEARWEIDSFRYSCKVNIESQNYLAADCRTLNGGIVQNNAFNRSQCIDGIRNRDGSLYCTKDPSHTNWFPLGSYTATCLYCQVGGSSISCQCKGFDGQMHGTRIDFSKCPKGLENRNGSLVCRQSVPAPND